METKCKCGHELTQEEINAAFIFRSLDQAFGGNGKAWILCPDCGAEILVFGGEE